MSQKQCGAIPSGPGCRERGPCGAPPFGLPSLERACGGLRPQWTLRAFIQGEGGGLPWETEGSGASLLTAEIGSVTGLGRKGAAATVHASHHLGVPLLPSGSRCPTHLGRLPIIDTARERGAALRKAERRYAEVNPLVVACFEEPPRVAFWYEAAKPRIFRPVRSIAESGQP